VRGGRSLGSGGLSILEIAGDALGLKGCLGGVSFKEGYVTVCVCSDVRSIPLTGSKILRDLGGADCCCCVFWYLGTGGEGGCEFIAELWFKKPFWEILAASFMTVDLFSVTRGCTNLLEERSIVDAVYCGKMPPDAMFSVFCFFLALLLAVVGSRGFLTAFFFSRAEGALGSTSFFFRGLRCLGGALSWRVADTCADAALSDFTFAATGVTEGP